MRLFSLPLLFAACTPEDATSDVPVCHEPDVSLYCTHYGGDGPCEPATLTEDAEPCGELMVVRSGPNLSGEDHVFRDGEHIGTQFWTDTNSYCGGYVYTYGEAIDLLDCR